MNYLFTAAVLPVALLCYYIYAKDVNREPGNVLAKLFFFGALIVIPVIIVEILLTGIFSTEKVYDFLIVFVNVFISIALVEEGFKWLVVRNVGYDNREFDEVYDIIVYAVFVSLGFACVENVLYVFSNGLSNAVLRAFTAIPGHTCFGVVMGYFMAKAKVASISNNNGLYVKNIVLSLLIPMLFHTMYDALLTWYTNAKMDWIILAFLLFDIIMVTVCFITVNKTSRVQQNLNENLDAGSIVNNNGQIKLVDTQIPNQNINFCPLCGTNVSTGNFCPKCGLKIR